MDHATRARAAEDLAVAERDRRPVPPLTETYGAFGVEDAYAVQQLNIEARRAAGGRVVGHKVGLTAKAMQEMLGVFEPDFGVLLDDMALDDAASVSAQRFLQPRVEPEVAFVLAAPLKGPGVTVGDVRAATRFVVPALELIDSRIENWRITLSDTIADNASSAAFVLGRTRTELGELDLTALDVELYKNGELVAKGSTSAVLGDPAQAVAWLANKLGELGAVLGAGEVVMPGSCTSAVAVAAGDRIVARFGSLGEVAVAFE
ncbi:MAG TPA: 2-keto-4-pentenoate hydratase [Acidimicrobiales bacterium]|nr:2-keto-4-pentenoate hydratase [Acidimicrobiales bacterium]